MKLNKTLLILMISFIGISFCWGQDSVYVDMRNAVTTAGTPNKLSFDIYVRANNPATYYTGMTILFTFDPVVLNASSMVIANYSALGEVFVQPGGANYNPSITNSAVIYMAATTTNFSALFPPNNIANDPGYVDLPTAYTAYQKVTIDYIGAISNTAVDVVQKDVAPAPYNDGVFVSLGEASSNARPYKFGYATSSLTFSAGLPVDWIDLTAQLTDDYKIRLEWGTEREQGNDYFVIQRGLESGGLFEDLAKVSAKGYSLTPTFYAHIDDQFQTKVNHYRIKQVDVDGKFSFSNTVAITIPDEADRIRFSVYPSPASDHVMVESDGPLAGTYLVKISDKLGREVYKSTLSSDVPSRRVDIQKFVDGIYNFEITLDGEKVKQGRFMKIKD